MDFSETPRAMIRPVPDELGVDPGPAQLGPGALAASRTLDRRLPTHRVLRRIARGERTEVVLAEPLDAVAGGARWVALKRLLPSVLGDEEATLALRREIELHGRLQHPRLPRILDRRIEGRAPWMTMEYVDGPDLSRLLLELGRRGRRLDLPSVLSVTHGLLDGLRYLHRAAGDDLGGPSTGLPVLHGDLCPANILLTAAGDVKITDLGRAWVMGRTQPAPRTTHLQMASLTPESVRDLPITERSDVFLVGTILYECLTGRHPHLQDSVQATARIVGLGEPTPVARHRPDVPAGLADLVERCLARDPEERPRSAGQVARELDALGLTDQGPRALVRELVSVFPAYNDAALPWALRGESFHPPFLPMVLSWLPAPPQHEAQGLGSWSPPPAEPPWEAQAKLRGAHDVVDTPLDDDDDDEVDTLRDDEEPPEEPPPPPPPKRAPPPAPPPTPKWWGIAVGASLGALSTALLFALFVPRTPTVTLPETTGSPASADPAVVRGAPRSDGLPAVEPPAPGEARADAVELRIRTEPPGAVVYIDGAEVGRSPVSVRRPSGTLLQVQARLDGYVPVARLHAVPSEDGTLTVLLPPPPR